MGRVFLLLCIAACSYDRGDFKITWVGQFPANRMTIGCLDLGVGLDPHSTKHVPKLRYAFGNGCDHRIRLDLAAVKVEGRDRAGRPVALRAIDAGWLGPRNLSARWFAHEVIAYEPVEDAALGAVCVDVGGIHDAPNLPPICMAVRS